MGYLEEMLDEEDGIETIFKEYVEIHNSIKYVFFFEGKDDINYYQSRITGRIGSAKFETFNCKGKKNVLAVQKMIKERTIKGTNECRLYFIDKDFDINITSYDDEIYVTPTYAIENFYVSDEAIKNIIKGLWGLDGNMSPDDKADYEYAIKYLTDNRDKFIDNTIMGNAWYSLQKRKGEECHKIVDLRPIKDYKEILGIKSVKELEDKVDDSITIEDDELNEEISRLSSNPVANLRGKYFEQYMPGIFSTVINDGKKRKNREFFINRHKADIQFQGNDMIRSFSCYADVPDCLVKYLSDNL